MKPKIVVGVLAALVLAGCASAQSTAERDRASCAERGLEEGSPAFNDCVTRLADARERQREERRARGGHIAGFGSSAGDYNYSGYGAPSSQQ